MSSLSEATLAFVKQITNYSPAPIYSYEFCNYLAIIEDMVRHVREYQISELQIIRYLLPLTLLLMISWCVSFQQNTHTQNKRRKKTRKRILQYQCFPHSVAARVYVSIDNSKDCNNWELLLLRRTRWTLAEQLRTLAPPENSVNANRTVWPVDSNSFTVWIKKERVIGRWKS